MKRILMTADTVGGVWVYALELAYGLRRCGVEVVLATMGAPLTREQRDEARGIQVEESAFRLEWMEDPWSDVARAGAWLLELEDDIQPDLVHLNGYVHGSLPFRVPKLVVGHSCVSSWWQAVKGEEPPAEWDCYRRAVEHGLGSADLVVTPTRAMLSSLLRHYGPLSRTRVIPNCRDAALFLPGDKKEIVFAAGRLWDQAKNVAALERVANRVSWPIFVAGPARHPDGGQVSCDRLNLLGPLSCRDIAPWFARASIYALPARYEPFGLSALEAGLAGCALVLGDIPSLREIWQRAAVFVSPDDPAALEHALQWLIRDGRARQDLAERARERALEFTSERMAGAYLDAYRGMLSAQRISEPAA